MTEKKKKRTTVQASSKQVMRVRAQTEAKHESVKRIGTTFIIAVKEPPQANRANTRIREILSRELMVPLAAVRLVLGHHKPSKVFEIIGNGIIKQ